MKIRTFFVSNSSSSSFCIAKLHMTPIQQIKFSDWITKIHENEDDYLGEEGGLVYESERYFHGVIDINTVLPELITLLEELKIEKKDYILGR